MPADVRYFTCNRPRAEGQVKSIEALAIDSLSSTGRTTYVTITLELRIIVQALERRDMDRLEKERLSRIISGIDHAGDAIGIFEPEGTFLYCNRAWKRLHRLDVDCDYSGQSDSVMEIPELRSSIDELKAKMEPGQKFDTRKTLEVDGTEKVFQVSVNFIADFEKPVVLVMFRDVTNLENARADLKEYRDRLEETVKVRTAELEEANEMLAAQVRERLEVERSLRESEEYIRTLFKALPVPTFTFRRSGETFIFEDFNDAAEAMTRGHAGDDIGKKVGDFLGNRSQIIYDLEKCYSGRKTIEYEREFQDDAIGEKWNLSVKYVFVPPNTVMVHTENITDRVSAEKELKEHRDRLRDRVAERTAELEQANKLLKDEIARRVEVQEALVESENKYRTISEMTSDYTFVASILPDGRLRREWMAGAFEKITGYSQDELDELLPKLTVIYSEDRGKLKEILLSFNSEYQVGAVEFRVVAKNGENVWVEAVAEPLPPSSEGYPRGMIAVRDINDRKLAEIELERRNRELTVVNRIREIFDTDLSDGEIMDAVLETLLKNSTAVAATVWSAVSDTGEMKLLAARNVPVDFMQDSGGMPIVDKIASKIIEGDKAIMVEEEPDRSDERVRTMQKHGIFKTVAFPVNASGRNTALFLIGYGKGRELGTEKMRFFDIVRNQVKLQFERRVLLADREWHEKKLKELTVSLIDLLEQERNTMALKLHDELGQELVAINGEILFLENQIESCEDGARETLAKIKEQLKELTQNVRKMSYSIHPAVLEDLGLVPALRSYIEKFVESNGLRVEIVTTGFDGKLIGDEALAMYRVAQEALTNVVKHSNAGNVTVKIVRGYPDLIMSIEDDGVGFKPESLEMRGKGLGIINMRERLEGMGGRFRLYSAPGSGTRIRASIPMEEKDDG
jgi:PAS domain S-box-containing protein